MLRIKWNDREGYFGEQFDIAAKCLACSFGAFFLGMLVGSGMSYEKGYKARQTELSVSPKEIVDLKKQIMQLDFDLEVMTNWRDTLQEENLRLQQELRR